MTDVPSSGPAGRFPRHVWVLLVLIVLVLGFALGGSLRTAFASGQSGQTSPDSTADKATTVARTQPLPAAAGVTEATGVARAGTAGPPLVAIGSPSRRGKALPAHSGTGRRIVYQ
ncbi:MAG: hypothetical protein ACHQE5_14410, partial [Actinomycetes bacterium]